MFERLVGFLFRRTEDRQLRKDPEYDGIREIPEKNERRGGNKAYAEWCVVAGIFRGFIYEAIGNQRNAFVVDIGCGTGLLRSAIRPFVVRGGMYLGIDVSERHIGICRKRYRAPQDRFILHRAHNGMYARKEPERCVPYPVESGVADIVTAVSVWTHLGEDDAIFYFHEAARMLKPGGTMIMTALIADREYEQAFLDGEIPLYAFDMPQGESSVWLTSSRVRVPEREIGLKPEAIGMMTEGTGMKLMRNYPGYWKKRGPGIYIQDVLIFKKE